MELICAARGAFAQRMLRLTPRQAETNGDRILRKRTGLQIDVVKPALPR